MIENTEDSAHVDIAKKQLIAQGVPDITAEQKALSMIAKQLQQKARVTLRVALRAPNMSLVRAETAVAERYKRRAIALLKQIK